MEVSEGHTHHERLVFLEKTVEEQEAHIAALCGAVAALLIDSAFRAQDTLVTRELAEFRDHARQRAESGGTKRIPASFFEHRAKGYQWLLDEVAGLAGALAGNYRRRSAFSFLDERDCDKKMMLAKQLERLAD